MQTTATNRKIRILLTAIRDKKLIPDPEFQRRLVWANKHKLAFLDTVLKGFPFPEIYIAAGSVNTETGEGTELLVDGQQRVTTLNQYFLASSDLKLDGSLRPYKDLSSEEKTRFLEYDVVVRDLGVLKSEDIQEVFQRINSTKYSLNAMEVHNARFDGAMKQFAETFAEDNFWERHRVFTTTDIRRMNDVRYALGVITTVMSTYTNRDDAAEEFLERFNDELPDQKVISDRLHKTLSQIEDMDLEPSSRAWKKVDLFNVIVEVCRVLSAGRELDTKKSGKLLNGFYSAVDDGTMKEFRGIDLEQYRSAVIQATNDRSSRIIRGKAVASLLSIAPKK